jgi:hypothetical protein
VLTFLAGAKPCDFDVKVRLQPATAYNILNASNEETADCMIFSRTLDTDPQVVNNPPNHILLTLKETGDYLHLPLWILYYLVRRGQTQKTLEKLEILP